MYNETLQVNIDAWRRSVTQIAAATGSSSMEYHPTPVRLMHNFHTVSMYCAITIRGSWETGQRRVSGQDSM